MQCNKPLQLPWLEFKVPCGKCLGCRISRSREWAIRLMHESYSHAESIFVTLTYNEENLPLNNQISKQELTLYLKRLRKRLEPRKIRYYACGEYGDETGRPHYHLIIFGLGLDEHTLTKYGQNYAVEKGPALDAWKKGFVVIGEVNYNTCRYTAEYIQKKLYGWKAKDDPRQQPFALMSKGLGYSFAEKHQQYLYDNLMITHQGVPMAMPKYYAQKLDLVSDIKMSQEYMKAIRKRDFEKKYRDKGEDPALVQRDINNHKEHELKKRSKLFNKDL